MKEKTSQDKFYELSSFLSENSKGDLYFVLQAITWYKIKLGFRGISRSAIARFAKCHVDTVSEINLRLEKAGIFQIERAFKVINTYRSQFWKELEAIYEYGPKCWLSSTSLFTSKLYIKSKFVSNSKLPSIFSYENLTKKVSEVGKVCFSKLTGLYIPLELRPLNSTIEISYSDASSLIGKKYNYLFPDYEKLERQAEARAKNRASDSREIEKLKKYNDWIESCCVSRKQIKKEDVKKISAEEILRRIFTENL